MTVLANDPDRRTNAAAIADLAELGWLRDDDHILDLTVGPNAGFWKQWRPAHLLTNDLDPAVAADYHDDATCTGWGRGRHDVVVFDPPYGYRGTSRFETDAQYGIADYTTPKDTDALLAAGTTEACRISRRLVLVKCQDSCVATMFHDQSFIATSAAVAAGARCVGKLYVRGRRAQPTGKKQLNVWGCDSVLLVFRVGAS